jgi:pyruvate, water dikinase
MKPTKIPDPVPGFEFDESVDFEQAPAWFLDGTHSVPPWSPMFGWFWINFCRHGLQYGAQKLSLPTVKGWDWRFMKGGGYLTILNVESKEEIRERAGHFREAMRPFIVDYDGLWQGFLDEILGRYAELKQLDLETASTVELLENFEQNINVCRRMWEIHMYMMYGVFTGYLCFENACRELLQIDDTDPVFHQLMTGFDNKVLQVDKRLWEFSKEINEKGLSAIVLENEPEDIEEQLEADAVGREFLVDFREFLEEDGWRMQRMSEINIPTWIEDPTPAFANIQRFLAKGGDFDLDQERAKLAEQRLTTEQEVVAKLAPEQKGWFTRLLRLAQKSGVFSEEHDHYLDLYTHALIRRCCLAIGRRLVAGGTIDDPEDIFFLIPDEVRRVALCPDKFDMHHVVGHRRSEWQSWCETANPPVLLKDGFSMDEAMAMLAKSNDPIALKCVVGGLPIVRPELKADMYGTCGSPGVAEGRARVVLRDEQLAEIEQGDILVAASTSPTWTPAFSLLGGIVVDRGASLSHAAIAGREYGIPVLMNVFTGTQLLVTGQNIRVDANMGALYILDK